MPVRITATATMAPATIKQTIDQPNDDEFDALVQHYMGILEKCDPIVTQEVEDNKVYRNRNRMANTYEYGGGGNEEIAGGKFFEKGKGKGGSFEGSDFFQEGTGKGDYYGNTKGDDEWKRVPIHDINDANLMNRNGKGIFADSDTVQWKGKGDFAVSDSNRYDYYEEESYRNSERYQSKGKGKGGSFEGSDFFQERKGKGDYYGNTKGDDEWKRVPIHDINDANLMNRNGKGIFADSDTVQWKGKGDFAVSDSNRYDYYEEESYRNSERYQSKGAGSGDGYFSERAYYAEKQWEEGGIHYKEQDCYYSESHSDAYHRTGSNQEKPTRNIDQEYDTLYNSNSTRADEYSVDSSDSTADSLCRISNDHYRRPSYDWDSNDARYHGEECSPLSQARSSSPLSRVNNIDLFHPPSAIGSTSSGQNPRPNHQQMKRKSEGDQKKMHPRPTRKRCDPAKAFARALQFENGAIVATSSRRDRVKKKE